MFIAAGESVVVVSRILGHANVATTEGIYVGLLRGSGEAAASRLGGFLNSARAARCSTEVVALDLTRADRNTSVSSRAIVVAAPRDRPTPSRDPEVADSA